MPDPTLKNKDRFWKLYLLIVGVVLCVVIAVGVSLFVHKSDGYSETGLVLGATDAVVEDYPFVELPRIYKDTLTHGWEDWSWDSASTYDVALDAVSNKSIKVNFKKAYGGFMLRAPHFDTKPYNSIRLSVFIPSNLGAGASSTLFIELADKQGKRLGSQLLSWYLPGKRWKTDAWQEVIIPLANLHASQTNVGSISVVSGEAGIIYLDNIEWSALNSSFPEWKEGIEAPVAFTPPLTLPFTADFYFQNAEWLVTSGAMIMEYSKMKINTGTSTNFASVLLKGGDFWTNYRYTTYFDWGIGDSVNIISRRIDDKNYFSCSFFDDGDNVTLYQIQQGEQKELDSAPNSSRTRQYSWSKTKSLGVEVKGDKVTCLVDGKEKLSHAAFSPAPLVGGVGIELWSPNQNQSAVSINKITVEKI